MAERVEWYRIMLDFIADLKIMFNEHADQFPPEMMVFLTDLESMTLSIVDLHRKLTHFAA